jgi:hypothetical protein
MLYNLSPHCRSLVYVQGDSQDPHAERGTATTLSRLPKSLSLFKIAHNDSHEFDKACMEVQIPFQFFS